MAGIEAIATTCVEDPVSSVTFSSIPQTYEHLQIRVSGGFDSSGNGGHQLYIRFNGNTASHYDSSYFSAYGSSHNADRYSGQSYVYVGGRISGPLVRRPEFGVTLIDIVDYTNPYKKRTMTSMSGLGQGYDGGSLVRFGGAVLGNSAALTSVLLYPPSGNFVRGTSLSLYGVND
jgi:hypothetical protein